MEDKNIDLSSSLQLISSASNVLAIDIDKEQEYSRLEERDYCTISTGDTRPLIHDINSMIRELITETRDADQRLCVIEQMLESFKGAEDEM
jgi:hypothetical protein